MDDYKQKRMTSAELRAAVSKGGHRAMPSKDTPGKPVPPPGRGAGSPTGR